jgi:DNA-binding MarR family transcriptional regulator
VQAIDTPKQVSPAALARELGALLVHLLKASGRDVYAAIGDVDLSLTQIKVLHLLEADGSEHSLKELAELFAISLPAMSRSVDGLHQRGLVERREDEHDRRMKRVRATAAGRAVPRKLNAARLSALEQSLSKLDAAERAQLSQALAPVLDHTGCRRGHR